MSSPRTMWSGPIELGLINIPVTIGKAAEIQRESQLVQVCTHGNKTIRIDRSERCAACHGSPQNKCWAVEIEEGKFRVFDSDEFESIEEATKLDSLTISDVQPANKLPLLYSFGAYYVRHNENSKIQPTAMATLIAAMMKANICLVCKWGNSSRQKLCVLSAESGLLVLRQIPFLTDIRRASKPERAHMRVRVDKRAVAKMTELLFELQNPDGFDFACYNDEGLRLRQAAVEKIVKGQKPEKKKKQQNEQNHQIDIFAEIDRAVENVRKDKDLV